MPDLLILLNHNSSVPPYEQIRLQLRTLIASASLPPGQRLPSVRQFANDLGVAPNTVVRAYNELEREGWIVTSARKGVRVADRSPQFSEQERRKQLASALHHLRVTAYQLGMSVTEVHAEIDRYWDQPLSVDGDPELF
ncbi:GntR family transcriptional regulator [Reticulibacter mediterranei]|uniref:GntR family transcriptional regulator n=1 Tax=Reticulibacter mediterranei TaxID=2778369 RepID=A0A8J3IAU3_9CHLR|nr:GntR family transcriptional regulator [Reticulibacter mediterranei]GHO92039.1 GntR family transcriptional regulator [Reticulibacter mediterranei]